MTIIKLENPIYMAEDLSSIDCTITFDTFGVPLPFTASLHDPEPHGIQIYEDLVSGKYGPIAPYVPKPPQEQPGTTGTQSL